VASRGLVIALMGVLLSPGTATAQETVESSLVRGRVLVQASGDGFMATVYGALPGSRIELACEGRCQMGPTGRGIPSSGVTVLRASPEPGPAAGDRVSSTLTDPQGRKRITEFRIDRNRLPVVARSCFDPAGNEVPCAVDCVRGARVPPEDPCREAGRRVRVPQTRFDWFARWEGRETRFTRLRISRLPEGVQLFLLCKTRGVRGCPFFVRALPLRRGAVDVARHLGRARFRAGVWFELHFLKASQTAAVVRWIIRNNRKPQVRRLCQAPHRFETHPC
jgi:hypothetical protein